MDENQDQTPLTIFLPFATKKPLRVLTVEASQYLPLLRGRYPNATIFAVTASADEAHASEYEGLGVTFSVMDYRETVLSYERKSFDIIIAPLCLETAANPQDIAAGFGTYIKDTGFLLTSFTNMRYYRVIDELMDGGYHYIVRRLFARDSFRTLMLASFYKDMTFSPVYGNGDEAHIKRLVAAGFKNHADDLNVKTWLVKAARSVPSVAAIKSRYTPETRRGLVTLLRRIEHDIDTAENAAHLSALCNREHIDADYLEKFIDETIYDKKAFQYNMTSANNDDATASGKTLKRDKASHSGGGAEQSEAERVAQCRDAKIPPNKKIAFITCVNDEAWYRESLLYQRHVIVPDGMTAEYIAIRGARSMAAGYNEAMRQTDAKYKIYLHQDTLIVNHHLIEELLRIFDDASVGLVGVIGCRSLPASGVWWDGRRTYGRVLHACEAESIVDSEIREPAGDAVDVEAVDGLFIATQCDVPWREDIFTGWHFYDTSLCMEMKRRNKRVVIPNQSNERGGFWCVHCPVEKPLAPEYKTYQKAFLREYGDELRPE